MFCKYHERGTDVGICDACEFNENEEFGDDIICDYLIDVGDATDRATAYAKE